MRGYRLLKVIRVYYLSTGLVLLGCISLAEKSTPLKHRKGLGNAESQMQKTILAILRVKRSHKKTLFSYGPEGPLR